MVNNIESQYDLENAEARKFLIEKLRTAFLEFFDEPSVNKLLGSIESGEIGPEELKRFLVQRLLATSSFENLLRRIIDLSPSKHLKVAVQCNLNDEIGLTTDGTIDPDKSHATWRRNFYRALEISDEGISTTQLNHGSKEYLRRMDEILDGGDAYRMAGFLLFLEGQIPREFKIFKSGRDTLFREQFLASSYDSDSVKAGKAAARMYLDDHISHDAKSHFPDLLNALSDGISAEALERIGEGVELAKNARVAFYQDQI